MQIVTSKQSIHENELEPFLEDLQDSGVDIIRSSELHVGRLLGGGAFCNVYSASLVSNCQAVTYDDLATKMVRRSLDEDQTEVAHFDLMNEARILSSLSHTNVIRLHGVCQGDGIVKHLLLVRLNDTLCHRLKQWRHKLKRGLRSVNTDKLLLQNRLRDVAFGIAAGLEYLHKQGIVHRDLKPQNIGFDCHDNPVLFDFGLARRIVPTNNSSDSFDLSSSSAFVDFHSSFQSMASDSSSTANTSSEDDMFDEAVTQNLTFIESSGQAGTPRYMAPEVARDESYSVAADVYSFAIILWEICTLKIPYQKYKTVDKLQRKVVNGKDRPSVKGITSKTLRNLLISSWCHLSDMRPPMIWIKYRLGQLINELGPPSQGNNMQESPTPPTKTLSSRLDNATKAESGNATPRGKIPRGRSNAEKASVREKRRVRQLSAMF